MAGIKSMSVAYCGDVFDFCAQNGDSLCACLFPLYDQVPRRQGGSNAWGIRFRFSSIGLDDTNFIADDGWTYDWTNGQNLQYVTLTGIKQKIDSSRNLLETSSFGLPAVVPKSSPSSRNLATGLDCQDFGQTVPTGIMHAPRNWDENGNCKGNIFQINFLDLFTGQDVVTDYNYKIALYDASDPRNLVELENIEASPTSTSECSDWKKYGQTPPPKENYCHENTLEPCLWCDPATDLDITEKRATKAFYVFNLKKHAKKGVTEFAYSMHGVCGNEVNYKGVKNFFSCPADTVEPTPSPTLYPTAAPTIRYDSWVGDSAQFVLGHAVADGATGYEESCVAPNLGKGFTYELTWVVALEKFDSVYPQDPDYSDYEEMKFHSTPTNNDFEISVSLFSGQTSYAVTKTVNVYAAFDSRAKNFIVGGEELELSYTTPVVCEMGNAFPTPKQTIAPSASPTTFPTPIPTVWPTAIPTAYPTAYPTTIPSPFPTAFPSQMPTAYPTAIPTLNPTAFPTAFPTFIPTAVPTLSN